MEKGARLGEYLLEESLGRGGFCEVWRGRHIMLGDIVALKVAVDEGMAEFLRREGLLQHRLEHKNIVRVLGGDVSSQPPYIVTEYISGGSLRAVLRKRGRLTQEETLRIIADVAEGLAFAHASGVVHCDVKPENILLDETGVAKVADFGFWRFYKERNGHERLALSLLSTEEVVGGTLEYMSPEQRRGEEPSPSDDVYSLGVVLFECLTGRLPAPGDAISDFVNVGENFEEAFARTYVRRHKRLADMRSFLNVLRAHIWGEDERRRTHCGIFVEEGGKEPPKDVADGVKAAVRFLRGMGADVGEESLRSYHRRGDVMELLFSERLGVVEFLYTISVKEGEVVGYNKKRRRR